MLCNPWKNGSTRHEMVTYYYPNSCFKKPVCPTTTTSTSSTTTTTTTQIPLDVCFFYATESSGYVSCLISPNGTLNGKPLYELKESDCVSPATGIKYVYWSSDNNRWESANQLPDNPFANVFSYLNVSSQTPISGPSNVWISDGSEGVFASSTSCPVINPPTCFTTDDGEIVQSWTSYPENTLYNNRLYYIVNGYYVYWSVTNLRWEFSSSLGGVASCFLYSFSPYALPNFYFSWECNESALVYMTTSSLGICPTTTTTTTGLP
jgi:hypothetical protein